MLSELGCPSSPAFFTPAIRLGLSCWAFRLGLNYTTGFPGSLGCRWQIVRLLSFHTGVSGMRTCMGTHMSHVGGCTYVYQHTLNRDICEPLPIFFHLPLPFLPKAHVKETGLQNLIRASVHMDLVKVLCQTHTFQAWPCWHLAKGLSTTGCSCLYLEPHKPWGPGAVADLPPRDVIKKAEHSGPTPQI